jgi:hypothetical protein
VPIRLPSLRTVCFRIALPFGCVGLVVMLSLVLGWLPATTAVLVPLILVMSVGGLVLVGLTAAAALREVSGPPPKPPGRRG